MSGTLIIGYLLAEQPICPDCIHELFIPFDLTFELDRSTEDILDFVATERGLDRADEDSFSTYRFPKPISSADATGVEVCIYCGQPLTNRKHES